MSHKRRLSDDCDVDLGEEEIKPSPKRRKLNHNHNHNLVIEEKSEHTNNGSVDRIINLQVGERSYTCRVSTLTQYGNDYFSSLFSGKFASNASYKDSYFIDRDGESFYYILQYLRSQTLIIPSSEDSDILFQKLLLEAEFYCIDGLTKYIKSLLSPSPTGTVSLSPTVSPSTSPEPQWLRGSQILSRDEQQTLQKFLREEESYRVWKLHKSFTYSAPSKQMITHKEEWRKKTQPTLVVIEDTEGNVFGVKSNIGIQAFGAVFSDHYQHYSESLLPHNAIYFNVKGKFLAQPNVICTEYWQNDTNYALGCIIAQNDEDCTDNARVTCLEVPEDLKTPGTRVIGLKGDGDNRVFGSEGKFIFSEFITAKLEIFLQT